jgi:formylglycine-generating enzyme
MIARGKTTMRHLSISPALLMVSTALGSCAVVPVDTDLQQEQQSEDGTDASISIASLPWTESQEQQVDPALSPATIDEPASKPALGVLSSACPAAMVLIEGQSCPHVEQDCLSWMEDPAKFPYARCAEFARPSICKGSRQTLRFCMDQLEAADDSGMPIGDISWTDASASCKKQGKRLCQEHEWLFACEGEEVRPYPYGYVRDPSLCNFEKDNLVDRGQLADYRQPVTSNPSCLSPFGVQNMVGNIDEWVVLDHPHWVGKTKMMSGLKGGWWGPLRNRCRPVTVDHDEYFHELQTGYRCCADVK